MRGWSTRVSDHQAVPHKLQGHRPRGVVVKGWVTVNADAVLLKDELIGLGPVELLADESVALVVRSKALDLVARLLVPCKELQQRGHAESTRHSESHGQGL